MYSPGTSVILLQRRPVDVDRPQVGRVEATETVSYQGVEMDPGSWLGLSADGTGEVGVVPPTQVKAWAGGGWPVGRSF